MPTERPASSRKSITGYSAPVSLTGSEVPRGTRPEGGRTAGNLCSVLKEWWQVALLGCQPRSLATPEADASRPLARPGWAGVAP
jgi:hypothetical protein